MTIRLAPASGIRRVAVVGLCAGIALVSGCSASSQGAASATPSSSASGGNPAEQLAAQPMPSWLPSQSAPGVAVGTLQKPALSYQGVNVKMNLDRGNSVMMTVTGPTAPAGTKVGAKEADLTWTVTISEATGTIPLSVKQFNVQDEAGEYHWAQPVKGSPIPATISKGQTVAFKIHTVASAGEGMVRWAPDGTHVIGLWDYIAELD
ncbi:hypothetical protein FYJ43_08120 [Cutibacterium sp. WCA-380-WT-3A]|uniref:DUF4352 domain-containing protein n=2 Tax=Cutibacterium porci TaxID=2605781 RepID=A0A7K0J846_9ACTN|nr:hypothetical protein [Cutibacterium porci]